MSVQGGGTQANPWTRWEGSAYQFWNAVEDGHTYYAAIGAYFDVSDDGDPDDIDCYVSATNPSPPTAYGLHLDDFTFYGTCTAEGSVVVTIVYVDLVAEEELTKDITLMIMSSGSLATTWVRTDNCVVNMIPGVTEDYVVTWTASNGAAVTLDTIQIYFSNDSPHGFVFDSTAYPNGMQFFDYDIGTGLTITSAILKRPSIVYTKPDGYGSDYWFHIVKDSSSHYHLTFVGTPHLKTDGTGIYRLELYNDSTIVGVLGIRFRTTGNNSRKFTIDGFAVTGQTILRTGNGAIGPQIVTYWTSSNDSADHYSTYINNLWYAVTDSKYASDGRPLLKKADDKWYVCDINTSTDKTFTLTGSDYPFSGDILVGYSNLYFINKIRLKNNGSWIQPSDIKVKYNGAWVSAKKVYVKKDGSWTLTYGEES